MSLIKDFKAFAMRGNIVDLAIGFTVGAAFGTIARSLVNDVIMPPIGLVLGRTDFSDLFWLLKEGSETVAPYATLADAQAAGAVTINYGLFLNNIFAFLVVAIAMFAIIRAVRRVDNELEEQFGAEDRPTDTEPTQKKCRFCRSTIPYRAVRCPHCTSDLSDDGAGPTEPAVRTVQEG